MTYSEIIKRTAEKNSDGHLCYAGEGANGVGCSAFARICLYADGQGVITKQEKDNNYSMWAGQGIPGFLNDTERFIRLPWSPDNLPKNRIAILYSNYHHVAIWDGEHGQYEACPKSHGLASNGKTAVGHFPNHGYYNCGTGTNTWTCIYLIKEKEDEEETQEPKVAIPSVVLKKGSTGEHVRKLQELLNKKFNAGLDVDGSFGPLTHRAVVKYQAENKLLVDGFVGPQTWTSLLS